MKNAAMGAFLGGVLVILGLGLVSSPREVLAQRVSSGNSAELITLTTEIGEARQQITVIDPQTRVMTVYHIEPSTGAIALKCVRNLHWDFQMEYFNGVNPLPREIRSLVESTANPNLSSARR